MPELRLARRVREHLDARPGTVREAVLGTLTVIESDPEGVGTRLVGALVGLRSARVGNDRVLYTIENGAVIIRAIRHGAVVYRRRRR